MSTGERVRLSVCGTGFASVLFSIRLSGTVGLGLDQVFRCVALALPVSSFLNLSNERQGDRVWINGKTRSSSLN